MRILTLLMGLLAISVGSMNGKNTSLKHDLTFDQKNYTTKTIEYNSIKMTIRAYEGIVYVSNPVDTVYQSMNIYIPEEYFNHGSINGYTSQTAPIFLPNQIGGYMPATPASTTKELRADMPQMLRQGRTKVADENINTPQRPPMDRIKRENAVVAALSRGYIIASPGARGRTSKNIDGTYSGKAPAAIIDLKAAVRYLKYNDKIMPGDANKIISNGTSAGGAMSSLLGATGDHADYLPYLIKLGAANTSDAIFATSAYCPITNLDHADMAYEWQFGGINTYSSGRGFGHDDISVKKMTEKEIYISKELKQQFPTYFNSLKLRGADNVLLTLDEEGEGSFKDFIKSILIASANKAITEGKVLSDREWISIKGGKVVDLSWSGYLNYIGRQKTPPAFDALNIKSAENNLFGTSTIDSQHFTEYGLENSEAKATLANKYIVSMMNPMDYIGSSDTKLAQYWRIRHGSRDRDTGLAVSAMLVTLLRNEGCEVDYAMPWDVGHSGDYDLDELFGWIDSICK